MTPDRSTPLGLVIAGGRSSRFGGEKAIARLGGRSLLEHGLAGLASCRAVAVSAAAGTATERLARNLGHPALADPPGLPAGPLSGVLAGLTWARDQGGEWLAIRPCDTPLTPPDLLERLRTAATPRGAFARTPEGAHPLCALLSVGLIAPLEARLAAGEHPAIQAFFRDQGLGVVDYADAAGFLNINNPADLAEAQRRLSAAG